MIASYTLSRILPFCLKVLNRRIVMEAGHCNFDKVAALRALKIRLADLQNSLRKRPELIKAEFFFEDLTAMAEIFKNSELLPCSFAPTKWSRESAKQDKSGFAKNLAAASELALYHSEALLFENRQQECQQYGILAEQIDKLRRDLYSTAALPAEDWFEEASVMLCSAYIFLISSQEKYADFSPGLLHNKYAR